VLDLLLERRPADAVLVLAPPGTSAPWQESLAAAAASRGVRALTPDDVNAPSVEAAVREHSTRLLLSVYYTQIFRQHLIDAVVDGAAVNFHPSLLPRHRGHAPIIWSIVEGDSVTGLSLHRIDRGVDTGPLIFQRSLPIHPLDTGYTLHQKMNRLVAATAAELLRRWPRAADIPEGLPQVGRATVHRRDDPQVNHLDLTQPAERVRNVVRALAPPLPGAYVLVGGRPIVLTEVESAAPPSGVPRPPGMVERAADGQVVIWAGDAPLRVVRFLGADGTVRSGDELDASGGVIVG
jgi:methionyl-tRNA formyltransferase